jgi:hypothetical protein
MPLCLCSPYSIQPLCLFALLPLSHQPQALVLSDSHPQAAHATLRRTPPTLCSFSYLPIYPFSLLPVFLYFYLPLFTFTHCAIVRFAKNTLCQFICCDIIHLCRSTYSSFLRRTRQTRKGAGHQFYDSCLCILKRGRREIDDLRLPSRCPRTPRSTRRCSRSRSEPHHP